MLLRTCDHCEAPAFIRNYSGPEAVLGHRKAQELGCVRVGYKHIRKHIGSIKSLRNVVGCQWFRVMPEVFQNTIQFDLFATFVLTASQDEWPV
jgi:hypothetical protein